MQRLPFSQANIFIDFRGIRRGYFIGGNPWKLSTYNNFDKVYRFCQALAQYRARCIEILHLQRSLAEARARVTEIENKLASATS